MKKILGSIALLSISSVAFGGNGSGCGLGQQLWKGQSGLAAHLFAGTTNGTVTSPLFGLVSGTSGCENPGMVNNDHQKKVFVAMNMDDLAQDMARGEGEHITSMATLLGIHESDQETFFQVSQANYDAIFSADNVNYEQVLASINNVMLNDATLSQYSTNS